MSSNHPQPSTGDQMEAARRADPDIPLAGGRYTVMAQVLHWTTAALMFVAIPLAWVGANIPETLSRHELLLALHKSVGLTILAIVVLRLAWRASHPPPALSASLAKWEKQASTISHWLLYLILVGMPLSGYVLSASSGRPTTYFGLFPMPSLPKSDLLQHAALIVHVITGQWLVYALVVLHLAATIWHVAVKRDGVLERMLPLQKSFRERS